MGGPRVLDGIDVQIGAGRSGLVGRNGVGKSTLVRLLCGEIQPTEGRVVRQGSVAQLSQNSKPDGPATVAAVLGIAEVLDSIVAVEGGEFSDSLYATIGDQWDIEQRSLALLDSLGLSGLALDRPVGTLSGGQATRVALAGLMLAQPDLLVLDEPTNHLDVQARAALYRTVETYPGALLVISHDRRLLSRMDRILELTGGGVAVYGGDFDAYLERKELERTAAARRLADAEQDLDRARSAAQLTREKQARGAGRGRRARQTGSQPRATLNKWKEQSEATSARQAARHAEKVDAASDWVKEALDQVERDTSIRLELAGTTVPSGRLVLELEGVAHQFGADGFRLGPLDLLVSGPERLALSGPNGSGKSTLARILSGQMEPAQGRVRRGAVRAAFLDQRTAVLADDQSLVENMRRLNPDLDESMRRWVLHRFLFTRDTVDRLAGVLSGGERMRAALACLLASAEPPQLLILDEPTNNLDLDAVSRITDALNAYRGALIVISHDLDFLADLGVMREIALH